MNQGDASSPLPSPVPLGGVSTGPRQRWGHFILRSTDSTSEENQIHHCSAQNPGLFGLSFRLQVISQRLARGKQTLIFLNLAVSFIQK